MRKWELEYQIETLPGCCGINVYYDLYYHDVEHDDYFVNLGDDENPSIDNWKQMIKKMTATIKATIKESRRKLHLLTLTDANKKEFKLQSCALKLCGWKLIQTTKSSHGRYKIYLFALNTNKWKKKK